MATSGNQQTTSSRFASLNDEEYQAIVNDKDSEATHKSTRKAVNILRASLYHQPLYLYNNNNIGWPFFVWYDYILHSPLKYRTRPADSFGISVARAVYNRTTLNAIQYYIIII